MAYGRLDPATVIARDFVVERLLGEGGMGAVYVALQPSTGKRRALKIMHRELAANPTLQRRFEQEARVGARIDSEHVVEVIAAGVDAPSGLPYLVMELLEGEDLRRRVERSGAVPEAEVFTIMEQLCHALAAAHRVDVVHRDLKPENVFLARSRRATGTPITVKLLDLGIAKLVAETSAASSTQGIGSPQWMAPEQTTPGPVTAAADVWALGLVAYELFTGRSFWRAANQEGATTAQLLREIVLDPIPTPSSRATESGVVARLPEGFDDWFARCVARDPQARFADAALAWRGMQKMLGIGDAFSDTAIAAAHPTSDALQSRPGQATVDSTPYKPAIAAETPVASVQSAPPPRARARNAPLIIGLAIAAAGLIGGWRLSQPDATPASSTASAPSTTTTTTPPTPTPTPPAAMPPVGQPSAAVAAPAPAPAPSPSAAAVRPPARPDGFSDPVDRASGVRATVQDKTVRMMTKVAENHSNVADSVLRKAIEWNSWQYLRCYERTFGGAKEFTDATVVVEYEVIDQLPRHAKVVSSTSNSEAFDRCVSGTLLGQTINAAGPQGAGRAKHAFKFIVVN